MRCWDKHKFRADKFLGQVTIKFNTALLQSSEQLDNWFTLSKQKSKEEVKGEVHLQIQYGEVKEGKLHLVYDHGLSLKYMMCDILTHSFSDSKTKPRSQTLVSENSHLDVKVSANFNTAETNAKLQSSNFVVVVEEEEEEDASNDKNEDYEKVRDGPSVACMEKINKDDKDVVLSNKNLDVSHYSHHDVYFLGKMTCHEGAH